MDCRFDKDIIQRYVDNTIDPLEYIFLKEHLKYCGECEKELAILTRIDEGFYRVFDADLDTPNLEGMIGKVVDECLYESERRHMLRFTLKKAVAAGTNVVENTVRFTNYLPGNKLIKAGAKKTTRAAGRLIKEAFRKEVKRFMASVF